MPIQFQPIPTALVRAYQSGGLDANRQRPEHHISDGDGNPCRHCLRMIPKSAGMLVLAHRPFPTARPYAEIGPIFLCAAPCAAGGGDDLPEILDSPDNIVRGYSAENRIVYGAGAVVALGDLIVAAGARLSDPKVAYVHVRSARNNCFQCRIERG